MDEMFTIRYITCIWKIYSEFSLHEDEFEFVASGRRPSKHPFYSDLLSCVKQSLLCVAGVIVVCLKTITLNVSVDCVRQLMVFTSVSQLCSSFSIVSKPSCVRWKCLGYSVDSRANKISLNVCVAHITGL